MLLYIIYKYICGVKFFYDNISSASKHFPESNVESGNWILIGILQLVLDLEDKLRIIRCKIYLMAFPFERIFRNLINKLSAEAFPIKLWLEFRKSLN